MIKQAFCALIGAMIAFAGPAQAATYIYTYEGVASGLDEAGLFGDAGKFLDTTFKAVFTATIPARPRAVTRIPPPHRRR